MTTPLTAKQNAFVDAFVQTREGPTSYKLAYNVENMGPSSISVAASELLANPKIAIVIERRTRDIAAQADFTQARALQMLLEIATADPRELIQTKIGACRYCWSFGNEYHWTLQEYKREAAAAEARKRPLPDCSGGLEFDRARAPNPDCPECSGDGLQRAVATDSRNYSAAAARLYGGVKETKNGTEILIANQLKAMELATRVAGHMVDRVRHDGKLVAAVAVAAMSSDPNEAARQYQDMVKITRER